MKPLLLEDLHRHSQQRLEALEGRSCLEFLTLFISVHRVNNSGNIDCQDAWLIEVAALLNLRSNLSSK